MASVSDRTPGEGRYAQLEREQRWHLGSLPAGATPFAAIVDRYIIGTRLRLRRVTSLVDAAAAPTFKLGQKVRARLDDPEVVKLTNIYLDSHEFEVFAHLPAAELHKTRLKVTTGGRVFGVDQFRGRHEGLVLAEIELGPDDELVSMLDFDGVEVAVDVTHDDRYSGGSLAVAGDDELAELVASPLMH